VPAEVSPIGRQLLRDEREPRVKRITALMNETARCFESGLYDAAVVMQFIVAGHVGLSRATGNDDEARSHVVQWFIGRYLRSDLAQEYQYAPEDAYAARCGILHTLGALSDLHHADPSIVIWRFHLGRAIHTCRAQRRWPIPACGGSTDKFPKIVKHSNTSYGVPHRLMKWPIDCYATYLDFLPRIL
jgi:hypothetical protein